MCIYTVVYTVYMLFHVQDVFVFSWFIVAVKLDLHMFFP